jgi:hypothetical protein
VLKRQNAVFFKSTRYVLEDFLLAGINVNCEPAQLNIVRTTRYERVMLVRCTRYHALQSPCILHLDKQQWTMAASKEPKGHPKPNGHPKD